MNDEEDIMKKLQKVANRDCNFCWQKGENCDGDECEKVIAEKILNIYNRQQERIEELEIITGLANNRKCYRKFVDEVFRKQKGKELSEPDFDYIYQLYFEQQAEIERLNGNLFTISNACMQRRNEAIKEFAERFIDEECAYCSSRSDEMIFFKERFDNFLAEMVGGENA